METFAPDIRPEIGETYYFKKYGWLTFHHYHETETDEDDQYFGEDSVTDIFGMADEEIPGEEDYIPALITNTHENIYSSEKKILERTIDHGLSYLRYSDRSSKNALAILTRDNSESAILYFTLAGMGPQNIEVHYDDQGEIAIVFDKSDFDEVEGPIAGPDGKWEDYPLTIIGFVSNTMTSIDSNKNHLTGYHAAQKANIETKPLEMEMHNAQGDLYKISKGGDVTEIVIERKNGTKKVIIVPTNLNSSEIKKKSFDRDNFDWPLWEFDLSVMLTKPEQDAREEKN